MHFFEAETNGKLATEITGADSQENWSKLSYIFKVEEVGKTIAELDNYEREQYLGKEEQSSFKKFMKWYLNEEKSLDI